MTDNQISKAVEVLKRGGIVIFPTDTAFGIGCRIDDENAVRKLFKIRRRPEYQAVPVLVDSVGLAEKYLSSPLSDNVRRLMNDNWPGGLTVICPTEKTLVTPLVTGGGKTLGVRMPDHGTVLEIIRKVGVPLLGPSANFHGDATPFLRSDLNPELVGLVDFTVEGNCKHMLASTVVDTTKSPWEILRPGAVNIDLLKYN